MSLDKYITLGNSGLRVSPLALGTMTFGEDFGWGSSVKESEQILDRYTELGGNFIDTANFYTKGHSEKIIGDHIGKDKSRRDRLVIATKFTGNLYPGDPNGGGAGRKAIINAAENSLRRLQTDYIDLYWLHTFDKNTPIEETMRALDDLVKAGKVRYIGASDTPAWKVSQANMLAHFRGWSSFIGLQLEYSLLERSIEQELIPLAKEFNIGVTAWSPLKSGILSGKYSRKNTSKLDTGRSWITTDALNEKTYDVIDALDLIAKKHDASPAQIALAWVKAQPMMTSPIIGARKLSQLEDNLKSLNIKLDADDLVKLDNLTKPTLGFPQSMEPMFPSIQNGGTSINGVYGEPSPFVLVKGEKPY